MPLKFFHPRYWLTWLGVGVLRLSVFLPWPFLMLVGAGIGKLLYVALPSRRKISCINIKIAFPDLSTKERNIINRQHFSSLGKGLFEAAIGWWGSNKKIEQLAHVEGLEYLENTLKNHRVILLGAHFVCLEMLGRIVALHMPLHAVYRPHQNKLMDYLVGRQRSKKYGKAIPKRNIREMIKSVKEGFPVWYATDQNYQGKSSIPVPFFGIETPTNPGTSRLAKITGAKIVPCIAVRLDGDNKRKGYLLRILPPLDDFPTKDTYQDTARLNAIIEEQVREFPSQYLLTHKRYKAYAVAGVDFYKEYILKQNSGCS